MGDDLASSNVNRTSSLAATSIAIFTFIGAGAGSCSSTQRATPTSQMRAIDIELCSQTNRRSPR